MYIERDTHMYIYIYNVYMIALLRGYRMRCRAEPTPRRCEPSVGWSNDHFDSLQKVPLKQTK